MSFREKKMDERAPLIQNPIIWTRSYDSHVDPECYGRAKRKETFQWLTFIVVTIISIFILLATVGFIMRASNKLPPVSPRPLINPTTPTAAPALPNNPPEVTTASTTTTTTTTTADPVIEDIPVSSVTT